MATADILTLRAGPAARRALAEGGLTPDRIGAMAGAAGGPKWLILSALDRYIFGDWLARADQPVALVGSSIGAWRFAAACHPSDPAGAIADLERGYVEQRYSDGAGRDEITATVRGILEAFFTPAVRDGVLQHPRYALHAITVRSRGFTASERRGTLAAASGLGALANAVSRRTLGAFFERVVFARDGAALAAAGDGLPTRTVALSSANARDAVYASGNIPLLMRGVVDPAGAPPGVYRDGGIVDYHIDQPLLAPGGDAPLVLMPHFDTRLVPGWFDKSLAWRRPRLATNTLLIGPGPGLRARLVDGRVPDRRDFHRYAGNDAGRLRAWRTAIDAGRIMRDAFVDLVEGADVLRHVKPL
ncbi:hypothetical protein SAOR_03480 [Salinisphaera orenii MK-B5]|uniref:Patatin-like phospholipase family protein n=1 Tax=Salinisphaera orenii MK-B5 TaxID=856730 RepID=A0A423PVA0_9GAMM|nr:patatin-like phospholipase family protein [Salinisphaera orenii]ROO29523.1 hypothetical protein SAOR_03480 [Salinisphaera orenii MK-B5]